MLDYCVCPKCERMIMLDGDFPTGFCLYCGTHIAFDEAREEFVSGLRSALPDEFKLEVELSGIIDEDDDYDDGFGITECREECAAAKQYIDKLDFAKAYTHYVAALDWRPADFEASCGRMTAGILKLNDVENWESRLRDTIALIHTDSDREAAAASLDYALGILKRFLSKGGRFVAPYYTFGFFRLVTEQFPALSGLAAEIFAHCLNIDNAPLSNAARLDNETTSFVVGSFSRDIDKNLRFPLALVMRYLGDDRKADALCRALYVYDREVWLRTRDAERINDVIGFMELMFDGDYSTANRATAIEVGYDFLMMGGLEQNAKPKEKLIFLSRVYDYQQLQRMERFFGEELFFRRVQSEVCLKKRGASSAEYRRIQEKIRALSTAGGGADYYNR